MPCALIILKRKTFIHQFSMNLQKFSCIFLFTLGIEKKWSVQKIIRLPVRNKCDTRLWIGNRFPCFWVYWQFDIIFDLVITICNGRKIMLIYFGREIDDIQNGLVKVITYAHAQWEEKLFCWCTIDYATLHLHFINLS